MNLITDLLRTVAEGGDLPDRDAITSVLRHGSRTERDAARRGIRIAAKQIHAIRSGEADADDPQSAVADILEAAAERFAPVTTADLGTDPPRTAATVVDAILARETEGAVDRGKRLTRARADRDNKAPLVEILRGAGKAGGVDGRDLDGIMLRPDMTAEQEQQWRQRAHTAGKRVADIWRTGAQGNAMLVADKAAGDLARELASTPQHRDPLADEEDPRRLAAGILGRPV